MVMVEISKMAAHNTISWSFIALAATGKHMYIDAVVSRGAGSIMVGAGAVCGTFLLRYMLDRLLFQVGAVPYQPIQHSWSPAACCPSVG